MALEYVRDWRFNSNEVKIKRSEKLEVLPIKKRYDSLEEAAADLGISIRDIAYCMMGMGKIEGFSFRKLTHIDLMEEEKHKKRREKVLKQNNIIHEKH